MNNELLELEYEYIQQNKGDLLIFPKYWEESDNDELKIKLLKEAIKDHKLITELKGIDEFIEGIK